MNDSNQNKSTPFCDPSKMAGPNQGTPAIKATIETSTVLPSKEMTQDREIPYSPLSNTTRRRRVTRRHMVIGSMGAIGLALLGGITLIDDFTVFNITLGTRKSVDEADVVHRTAEISFPPPGTFVPQTIKLVGHARGIGREEDLRIEVKNDAGQFWYKKMKFGEADAIYRDDHHIGLIGGDVGRRFWLQLVIVKAGTSLDQGDYRSPQPVVRIGKPFYYDRRQSEPGEVLTPDSWRAEMIAKGEHPPITSK